METDQADMKHIWLVSNRLLNSAIELEGRGLH